MRPKLTHYLAYSRPLSIPVTMVMVMTGWLASPAHARTLAGVARDVGLLALVYSVLMWGGANAFNSAEDRDEGPVNLLPSPPPLPLRLGAFGIGLQLAGVLASAVFGLRNVMLAAVAAVTSVFYSWRGAPWRRGKEIPGVDNLINAGGCGFGSFLYGWCATGAPLGRTAAYLCLAWTVCLFGGIPTAQIFQLRPGESVASARNWTSWLGAARTLQLGALLFAAHFLLIAWDARLQVTTLVWGAAVLGAVVHSAWWSRTPFEHAHGRMLRQMTLLTAGQLAWAIGQA
jgi:hypothetical protein